MLAGAEGDGGEAAGVEPVGVEAAVGDQAAGFEADRACGGVGVGDDGGIQVQAERRVIGAGVIGILSGAGVVAYKRILYARPTTMIAVAV